MNKFIMLLLLLLLSAGISHANAPQIGEKAAPLQLTGLLQASGKMEQNIKSLQGKVVVLEFWATWCAPCIAAMPHLNNLSDKYKAKGIQFISITDETDTKAKEFLKKRNINGWVGIDSNRAMHEAYEVQAIPFTVVIGADGTVLGYPISVLLSEEMLNQALAGQVLSTALPTPVTAAAEPVKPLYELSIRHSVSTGMSNMIMPKQFRTQGSEALDIIKIAFEAKDKQVEVAAPLPEGRFDVVAMSAGKGATAWAWQPQLQQMLQQVWGLDVRQEQKELEVYELVVTPTAARRLKVASPEEKYSRQSSDNGVLVGRSTNIATLIDNLQKAMAIPIVDATNLSGNNYDYNLYYDENKPETLMKALEDEMGLQLRKVTRTLDVLVIAPKQ